MQSVKIISHVLPISIQDSGRYGYRKYGVPISGFMDAEAAAIANKLAGNLIPVATIEYAYGGLKLEVLTESYIGVFGAGQMNIGRLYKAGEWITIPMTGDAVWGYVAIYGGFKISQILESVSKHSRAEIGKSIEVGDELLACHELTTDKLNCYYKTEQCKSLNKHKTIRIARGPHFSLLGSASKPVEKNWKISHLIDRSGYRIIDTCDRHSYSLKSIPLCKGAIQWTPGGELIVAMADGPTVGGYPIIGVVHEDDLSTLAQCVPESIINTQWYDFAEL